MYGYGVSTEQGWFTTMFWTMDVIWCYMFSFGGLWVWVKTIWPLKRMVSPSLCIDAPVSEGSKTYHCSWIIMTVLINQVSTGYVPSGTQSLAEDCERQICIFHHIPISCANLALPSKSVLKKWPFFLEKHGLHDINWADPFILAAMKSPPTHGTGKQKRWRWYDLDILDSGHKQIWDQPQSHMAMQDHAGSFPCGWRPQQNWTNSLHSSEKCLVAHFHRVWTVLNSVFHIFLAWWWMTKS